MNDRSRAATPAAEQGRPASATAAPARHSGPSRADWITALAVALGLVLAAHWRLAIGQGVIGGDPDRAYLPYKAELQRALREGRLPHWSDRLGLGVPLLAESQVAALYPPHWLYAWLDVARAYHLLQLLHYLALAGGVFCHARWVGAGPWGAALASVSFPLCGFLAIHASHEVFTLALAWTPWALAAAEAVAQTGRTRWAIALTIVLAMQLLVGHFQMQFFTIVLVGTSGTIRSWHLSVGRSRWRRMAAIWIAPLLAGALAAPQLLPTWEATRVLGWAGRSVAELTSFMYPPWHFPELLFPRLFQLPAGPEAPYWHSLRTTGYESYAYLGVVPLVLAAAAAGLWRRSVPVRIWAAIAAVALVLSLGDATYAPPEPATGVNPPSWWSPVYHAVLRVPGFGYFRAPARYTVVVSYAGALLAGLALTAATRLGARGSPSRGVAESPTDGPVGSRAVRVACVIIGVAVAGIAAGVLLPSGGLWARMGLSDAERLARLAEGLAVVVPALAALWYVGRRAWLPAALVLFTALEMGITFQRAPLFRGPLFRLPQHSPVLDYLARHRGDGRVAGLAGNQNLPVRAGTTVLEEYLGVTFPTVLKERQAIRLAMGSNLDLLEQTRSVCDLLAVEFLVWDQPLRASGYRLVWRGPDAVLDQVLRQQNPVVPPLPPGEWRIYRRQSPVVLARLVRAFRTMPSREEMAPALVFEQPDLTHTAWLLPEERPPFLPAAGAEGRVESAVVAPGRVHANVIHAGPAYLLISQQMYPGWTATLDGRPTTLFSAFGGLQLVPLPGAGVSEVELRYEPRMFHRGLCISAGSAVLLLGWCVTSALRRRAP